MAIQYKIRVKQLTAMLLAACLGLGLVWSVRVPDVQASNLDDLQAKQAALAQQIAEAKEDVAALGDRSGDLSVQLDQLREKQQIDEDAFTQLTQKIGQADQRVKVAYTRYENAVRDLAQKQREFEERVTSLFRIRNKSTLEVLLQSDSMQGFFTNMRLMSYISSVDQSMLSALEDARVVADHTRKEAEQTKAEFEAFAAEKQTAISQAEQGIHLTLQNIGSLEEQIMKRSGELEHYESEQVTTTGEIESFMEAARQKAEEDKRKREEAELNAAAAASRQAEAASVQASINASIEEENRLAAEEEASISASVSESIAVAEAEESRRASEAAAQATTGANGETEPQIETTAAATPPSRETTAKKTTAAIPQDSGGNSGGGAGAFNESAIYPIPNYTGISDDFGYRSDPATGETRMHWGVDFPAPAGTPVVASNSGEVIIASAPLQGETYGWANNGFGNYVSVMRDDGVIMMYAHLKYVSVSKGERVSRGEVIGQVGSTGYSTGAHLHFQVRSPYSSDPGVNPWNYLN